MKQQPLTPQSFEYRNIVAVNDPTTVGVRRTLQLYNPTGTAVQLDVNRGVYSRPQVGPIEYAESNIKKSRFSNGVAGYIHHQGVLTDNPDDMSVQEYVSANMQAMEPAVKNMQNTVLQPKQEFLKAQRMPEPYETFSGNMVNNLLALAKMKKAKPAK